MLDSMTVYFHDKVVFVFKDGSKVEQKIDKQKVRRLYTFVRKFFYNSAVTFLPTAENYLAQQFSSGTIETLRKA